MARTVIQCRYTGNYIISSHEDGAATDMFSGRIYCPYCNAGHVWSSAETSSGGSDSEQHSTAPRRMQVRQAS